ncbi:MAG: hypothetical protein ABIF82_09965 [Planctomycetota bacterium]
MGAITQSWASDGERVLAARLHDAEQRIAQLEGAIAYAADLLEAGKVAAGIDYTALVLALRAQLPHPRSE